MRYGITRAQWVKEKLIIFSKKELKGWEFLRYCMVSLGYNESKVTMFILCCVLLWLGLIVSISLKCQYNKHDAVSNHRLFDCLLNCLFRCRSKKTSKLHVTGLCEGNPPMTGGFPPQRASNAGKASIWWCHRILQNYHSGTGTITIMLC